MELLLNLAWLLLAVPAYWLWCESRSAYKTRRFASLQVLLTLGCMLVILFPVVSASDDLVAMRTEMEEAPASKRSVCQKSGEKGSAAKVHRQPLVAVASEFFIVHESVRSTVPVHLLLSPGPDRIDLPARAPPLSVLA